MSKAPFDYRPNDTFYDLESKPNVFTDAQYQPSPKSNRIIVSILQDSPLLRVNPDGTFNQDDENVIRQRIYAVNPLIAKAKTPIFFENLKRVPTYAQYNDPSYAPYSLTHFAKRIGIANLDSQGNPRKYRCHGQNNFVNDQGQISHTDANRDTHWVPATQYNQLLQDSNGGSTDVYAQFYPIKDTDPMFNPDKNGLVMGYNSTNYDLTMLANFFASIDPDLLNQAFRPNYQCPDTMRLTARELRDVNDQLFKAENISNMPSTLDYRSRAWFIYRGWLNTNRFIDVSRLNEKQRKVSLKRLSGMLGLQIKESAHLGDDNDPIRNLDELAELIAYNMVDTYNTRKLFEHPVYLDSYKLKSELLRQFPAMRYLSAYTRDEDIAQHPREASVHAQDIRGNRLRSDSTSAQFIANLIAPYRALDDIPAISFMYPAAHKLAAMRQAEPDNPDLPEKPYDVLEATKQWAIDHMVNGEACFQPIYDFYATFRGRNVNKDIDQDPAINTDGQVGVSAANEKYGTTPRPFIKDSDVARDHQTNIFYYNDKGEPTSSVVHLSIGGIHGAEIMLDSYRHDLAEYQAKVDTQNVVKQAFNDDPQAAKSSPDKVVTAPDGAEIKIRSQLSSSKNPNWKKLTKPQLFKIDSSSKQAKLNKKYAYTSVDPANHEDFSSYYPTLLVMLEVFLDETETDPYAEQYYERLALKAKLKKLKKLAREADPATNGKQADLIKEIMNTDLAQTLRKLLLNAASGAGDANFASNIKMNNAIVSMRIIGQLFAWRIGQAEALHGARVPSTNTDGLYTMGISSEVNNRVLAETIRPMLIGVDGAPLQRFVSKDANNRLEYNHDQIMEAKGGTLTSHAGPDPRNSLSHPAICDAVLAEYLANEPDPCNVPFNQEHARQYMLNILLKDGAYAHPEEKLRMLQWIVASSIGKARYNFVQTMRVVNETPTTRIEIPGKLLKSGKRGKSKFKTVVTDEVVAQKAVLKTNRIFLTKRPATNETYDTMAIITAAKLSPATINKRHNAGEVLVQNDRNLVKLMEEYISLDEIQDRADDNKELSIVKVSDLGTYQPITIENRDLSLITHDELVDLYTHIDLSAYLTITQGKFEKSWLNPIVTEKVS